MRGTNIASIAAAAAFLTGCAVQPVAPTVRVMPAPYKPFEVFEQEHYDCQRYASSQVMGAADAANNRAIGAAAIGTGLGLALGAATGNGNAEIGRAHV